MWNAKSHGVRAWEGTLVYGAADTVKDFTLPSPALGTLAEIDFSVPVWTNSPTLTFSLIRANGTVAWTGTARSKGASTLYFAEFPDRVILGGEILRGTLSGAPGGSGGNVTITAFGR